MTVRREYARRMVAGLPEPNPRVEQAFAAVPRERFVGPPPWSVIADHALASERGMTEEVDPARLYDNVLVRLDGARHVNNGSPALHALMLHHLGVRVGDRVLHVGAGTGYYTALIAELVGPEGSVEAVEFDARLAGEAAHNLAAWPQAVVRQADAACFPQDDVDRIYVNFGLPAPSRRWLDRLLDRGTLELPLCARHQHLPFSGRGAVFAITRKGEAFSVRFVSPCGFVMAEGSLAGDPAEHEALAAAFHQGGAEFVRSLRLAEPDPSRCFFWSPNWSLSYDDP
ncbi:MAG: hypothetical protein JO326_05325 [Acetobacteraceae bacterium]|nr:hypothetical protein [Acetobacteraceae bacterium]